MRSVVLFPSGRFVLEVTPILSSDRNNEMHDRLEKSMGEIRLGADLLRVRIH